MAVPIPICMYCNSKVTIAKENGKRMMKCPKCGKKELTSLGFQKLHPGDKVVFDGKEY